LAIGYDQRGVNRAFWHLGCAGLGGALALLRFGDGRFCFAMQVHRGHWVARRAMHGLRRENGRLWLLLQGGFEVPVSRAYQAAIRALDLP